MQKPYIFCHMMTSMDGKIMGTYMDTPEGDVTGDVFYNLAFGAKPHYHHQGWVCGRVTTDDNFTMYRKPALDENAPTVPEGDFIAKSNAPMYYVSVDPSGKLGWESEQLRYIDTTAHIIEVLSGKASNAYKAFLRKLGISYVLVGEDAVDYQLLCEKLCVLFGIQTLMLGGGGVLNWSFLQAGLCDEVSIVITAAADGSSDTPTLFETRPGISTDQPIGFTLKSADVLDGGSVWLRYASKNGDAEK